jgi:two-component system NtrC family sensor kinase
VPDPLLGVSVESCVGRPGTRAEKEGFVRLPRWTHSLKWRIVASYSLILIAGGVSTSIIGIRVTGRALLQQAQHHVDAGLCLARTIYANRLIELRQCVELLATSRRVRGALTGDEPADARDFVRSMQQARGLDFLSIADAAGRVGFRTTTADVTGDSVADLAPIAAALNGEPAASTELLPLAWLEREAPALAARLGLELAAPAAATASQARKSLDAGLLLLAAAPVKDDAGQVVAVLYTGKLLNEIETSPGEGAAHGIVDEIRDDLFPGLEFEGRPAGTATIFQDDIRISTNVMTAEGRRALGTRVSREVYDAVMIQGQTWRDRAFVVNDWYISAYEPITSFAGERIGMLYVGLLERPYTAVRDNVTLAFALIALFCFALIVVVTSFLTRSLMRPLEEIVAVSKEIAAGDLNHRVRATDQSELGVLSGSLNTMLDRISEMNAQLGQWAETLEQKVRERTEQLARTQAAMHRQQRLASLGQLAAGVAHEINNPLTGVLTFAHLLRQRENMDEQEQEDLDLIINETTRVGEIVSRLLDFAREKPSVKQPLSINDVIRRTMQLIRSQKKLERIAIKEDLHEDLPRVNGDKGQLEQVLLNLSLNACEAMPDGGTLTVSTAAHDGNVLVKVTDTGCGIKKEHLDRIFEPFFSTRPVGQGTGLGLSVSYGIVQQHGGSLEVDSREGEGTTFTMVLPGIQGSDPSATTKKVGE